MPPPHLPSPDANKVALSGDGKGVAIGPDPAEDPFLLATVGDRTMSFAASEDPGDTGAGFLFHTSTDRGGSWFPVPALEIYEEDGDAWASDDPWRQVEWASASAGAVPAALVALLAGAATSRSRRRAACP